MDETTAIVAAVVAVCWLIFQLFPVNRSDNDPQVRARFTRKTKDSAIPKLNKRYAAVSIIPGGDSCYAVESLGNIRFLLPDAPLLPVSNCDRGRCNCRYRHHYDRRRGLSNRRRAATAMDWDLEEDRRFSRGRRAADRQLA